MISAALYLRLNMTSIAWFCSIACFLKIFADTVKQIIAYQHSSGKATV